ncbi:DUF1572 domain-containing protein [Acidicapsa ligni]|uniref:DUF1572 domain-containing protein n=1 Tax=Acidicapsa ligni TaxID=542300 RepID=UPI0021DF9664|nr:DUF1572 domain-containing protein [Acidicapsa ligni]
MALKFTTSYLEDSIGLFYHYKKLTDDAMAQLTDEQLYITLDPEMNSIAIVVKHMSGNMQSRWSDLLATDGEKPWRNRDAEFCEPPGNRDSLLECWEVGWATLFGALKELTEADLVQQVMIRGEAHSVMQAINRQMAHYSYHCGQIVFLAKHLQHASWQTLSVPRGQSEVFNQKVARGEVSQR